MYDGYYLQVEDKETGEQFPIPEAMFDGKRFAKVDEDPTHPLTGEPLSAKPRTTVSREAAKKTGQKPSTQKENG